MRDGLRQRGHHREREDPARGALQLVNWRHALEEQGGHPKRDR